MRLQRLGRMFLTVFLFLVFDSERGFASGPELPSELETETGGVEAYREGTDHTRKLHFWGYGEVHYEGERGTSSTKRIDFHRFVIGSGYDFTDRIVFRSEFDAEHGFKEPYLEFAYLDFLLAPAFNIRAGSILMPIGIINEHHEPPLFNGVERPELYVNVIPTTWMEGGVGFHGEFADGWHYQLYGVQGLSSVGAAGTTRFTASSGLRSGRAKVIEADARDFAGVARLEYIGLPGLRLGVSGYGGNSSQGDIAKGGLVLFGEADASFSLAGLDIEGIATVIKINNADLINGANGFTGTSSVGSTILGAYGEAGYHLLRILAPSSDQDVVLFGRYEWYDTQYRVPSGFARDGNNRRTNIWAGLTYRPVPQVAAKANVIFRDDTSGGRADKIELGLGYYF